MKKDYPERYCDACGSEMRLLLVTYCCDYCDGIESSEEEYDSDLDHGYIDDDFDWDDDELDTVPMNQSPWVMPVPSYGSGSLKWP